MRVAALILCLLPFAALAQNPSQIVVRNAPDKIIGQASAVFTKGKTHSQIAVQANPMRLFGDTTEGLFLSPNFIIPGRKIVAPAAVEFEFISYSAERKFASNRSFEIQSQGQTLFSQTLTLATSGRSNEGIMTEVLVTKVPYHTFTSLIRGTSLVLMVGGERLELTETKVDALRDLKRMVDSGISF